MSPFDKLRDSVTPKATPEQRAEARRKAQSAAKSGDWLSLVLDHHQRIEAAFAEAKRASSPEARHAALKQLGGVLTGHAIAEESVLYPALAGAGDKGDAQHAYHEQIEAKMHMAHLEKLDPMSEEAMKLLADIEAAVAHHMVQEEGDWFCDLHTKASAEDQRELTHRYREEFERYVGGGHAPAEGHEPPRTFEREAPLH